MCCNVNAAGPFRKNRIYKHVSFCAFCLLHTLQFAEKGNVEEGGGGDKQTRKSERKKVFP